MIEITGVSYTYAGHGQDEPPALSDVTLSFAPGQLVALLGHNGSGKTTLAKLVSGVLRSQSGSVVVDGFDTRKGDEIWEVRRRVGLVFQQPDDQLVTNTVVDDIAFGPENLGLPREEIEARIAEVISWLDLKPYLDVPINELSIGQKQRVAIAGVLAMRPRYLVLDEPTSMLPPQLAEQLLTIVHRLAREQQVGVIYITHSMDEAADFDRILVVDRGYVVLDGMPRDVFGAVERMRALGLDIPLATEMGRRLAARGLPMPAVVLTNAELLEALGGGGAAGGLHDGARPPDTPAMLSGEGRRPVDAPTMLVLDGGEAGTGASVPGEGAAPEEPAVVAPRATPILEARDLSHVHLKGTPFAQVGLAGLSMVVPVGTFVACVGATRSGKSTLVDCLNGIIRPGRNMVYFSGQDIAAPGFDLDRLRAAVGVVYQEPETQILKDIVGKDIAFGPMRKKVSLAESRRIVQESLEAVGLPYEEFRNRYTYALSGGQKRRVAIAGVLATQPQVLVLDEPTAGLDPRGRNEFLALVRRLHVERGLTVVYMTSSMEDVLDLATHIYVLDSGRVAFGGAPREVMRRLPELSQLQIGLSSTSRLALDLRALYPDIATDSLHPDELEREILRYIPAMLSLRISPQAAAPEIESEATHD